MKFQSHFLFATVCLCIPNMSSSQAAEHLLSLNAYDIAVDIDRRLIYGSETNLNRVSFISLDTGQVVNTVTVPGEPFGIDLSWDGSTLFVALRHGTSVVFINPDTLTYTIVDVGSALSPGRAWDILQVTPTRVYVSPDDSASSYKFAEIQLDNGNHVVQRAVNASLDNAHLAVDTANQLLYAGSNIQLSSFDLTNPALPVVARDEVGVGEYAVSRDGQRFYRAAGQIQRSSDFVQLGRVSNGTPAPSEDGSLLFVASEPHNGNPDPCTLFAYDSQTLRLRGQISLATNSRGDIRGLVEIPGNGGFVVTIGESLYIRTSAEFCDGAPLPPNNPKPGNGLVRASVDSTLSWRIPASSCFTWSDVYFGTDNPPSIRVAENLEDPFFNCGPLSPNTNYYWQVVSRNDLGETPGPVWGFRTNRCPSPTVPLYSTVNFGGDPWDCEVDSARGMIYVSIPSQKEVDFISMQSMQVVRRVYMASAPRGLAMTIDGSRLLVALSESTSIAVCDPDTGQFESTVLGPTLQHPDAWDVVEAQPDRIFVSANPPNGQYGIVQVQGELGDLVSSVTAGRFYTQEPIFGLSPDRNFLYIGEGISSPEGLHKLALSQSDPPVVLERNGIFTGVHQYQITPDGSKIVLRSGQVLSSSTLVQTNTVAAGIPRISDSPNALWVASGNLIRKYSLQTFGLTGIVGFSNSITAMNDFRILPDNSGVIAIGNQKLVYRGFPPPAQEPIQESPSDMAVIFDRTPALTWIDGDGECAPSDFTVYLGTQDPPASTTCIAVVGEVCETAPLQYNVDYYWRVAAVVDSVQTLSDVRSFRVEPLLGDVNGDGLLSLDDVGAFAAVLVGTSTDTNTALPADTNGDGIVNAEDIPAFLSLLIP